MSRAHSLRREQRVGIVFGIRIPRERTRACNKIDQFQIALTLHKNEKLHIHLALHMLRIYTVCCSYESLLWMRFDYTRFAARKNEALVCGLYTPRRLVNRRAVSIDINHNIQTRAHFAFTFNHICAALRLKYTSFPVFLWLIL